MTKKEKELTNKEHNNAIFKEIKEAESAISALKDKLKPVEPVKNATLAECNAIARRGKAK